MNSVSRKETKATRSPTGRSSSLQVGLVVIVALLLFVWFFGTVLTQRNDLIFRDAGRFYLPLFRFVQAEWEAGRVPLWNPYENSGAPLMANPTMCVWYPPKLLFWLPQAYETNFKLFLLSHVVFCLWTTYRLARSIGCETLAAGLAAIVFTFSGTVLFQYCNLIFLISAAWLPLALMFGIELVKQFSLRSLLGLTLCLTMMVLGGDPQMAYHVGLLLGLLLIVGGHRLATADDQNGVDHEKPRMAKLRWFGARCVALLVAAAFAGLLSAIQILPTAEFSARSVRATSEVPRSLWQVPGFLYTNNEKELTPRPDTNQPPNWYDSLIGDPPQPAKFYLQSYSFSFPLFRTLEFLLPNAWGLRYDNAERWTKPLKWEGEFWVLSVFLGITPLWLALVAASNVRRNRIVRWLLVVTLLSLVASYGRFGLGWLWHITQQFLGNKPPDEELLTGGEVGGLYWFMSSLLPGYWTFRFPAKWLTIVSLGLALLGGLGLESLPRKTTRQTRTLLTPLLSIFAVVLLIGGGILLWALYNLENDELRTQAVTQLGRALIWLAVCAALASTILFKKKPDHPTQSVFLKALLLVVTALELGLANGPLVISAPRAAWRRDQPVALALPHEETARPLRIYRPFYFSPKFKTPPTQDVDTISILRERAVLGSYSQHEAQIGQVFNYSTIVMNAYESFFEVLPLQEIGYQEEAYLNPRRSYDLWGVDYFVLHNPGPPGDPKLTSLGLARAWTPQQINQPQFELFPQGPVLPSVSANKSNQLVKFTDLALLKNTDRFPHAWIVRDVRVIEPIALNERHRWLPVMLSMLYPRDDGIDLRRGAYVETGDTEIKKNLESLASDRNPPFHDSVEIIAYAPQKVVLETSLAQPGLMVVADTFYPGWKAEVVHQGNPPFEVPILRTNRMQRGVLLEAGRNRITFTYQPRSFFTGATVSLLAWFLFLGVFVSLWLRKPKTKSPTDQ